MEPQRAGRPAAWCECAIIERKYKPDTGIEPWSGEIRLGGRLNMLGCVARIEGAPCRNRSTSSVP